MASHLLLYVLIAGVLAGQAQAAEEHVVRIRLTGITEAKGSIRARLDASAKAFSNDAPPALTEEFAIDSTEVELVFRNVPPGTYAVKVFHDENDDREMNTNLLGIPSEKYGISQNARGRFGLPAFEKARFEVKDPETVLSISLKHHAMF